MNLPTDSDVEPMVKMTLRIPRSCRNDLKVEAIQAGQTLNDYVTHILCERKANAANCEPAAEGGTS